jgi:hypothetical protein
LLAVAAAAIRDPIAQSFKDDFRQAIAADPIDSVLLTVLVSSYLFFHAEKGENPKVVTFADALVFVSTSLSVGYSDIFPRTEKGKLIATALQMFGPAMTARVLEPPKEPEPPPRADPELLATQRELLAKLDAIFEELRARRSATPPL